MRKLVVPGGNALSETYCMLIQRCRWTPTYSHLLSEPKWQKPVSGGVWDACPLIVVIWLATLWVGHVQYRHMHLTTVQDNFVCAFPQLLVRFEAYSYPETKAASIAMCVCIMLADHLVWKIWKEAFLRPHPLTEVHIPGLLHSLAAIVP